MTTLMQKPEPEKTEEIYLSAKTVARRLGVSLTTIIRLLNSKELVGFRVGNLWKISETDLQKYIEAQKQK